MHRDTNRITQDDVDLAAETTVRALEYLLDTADEFLEWVVDDNVTLHPVMIKYLPL